VLFGVRANANLIPLENTARNALWRKCATKFRNNCVSLGTDYSTGRKKDYRARPKIFRHPLHARRKIQMNLFVCGGPSAARAVLWARCNQCDIFVQEIHSQLGYVDKRGLILTLVLLSCLRWNVRRAELGKLVAWLVWMGSVISLQSFQHRDEKFVRTCPCFVCLKCWPWH
jgi:hypothetical protein